MNADYKEWSKYCSVCTHGNRSGTVEEILALIDGLETPTRKLIREPTAANPMLQLSRIRSTEKDKVGVVWLLFDVLEYGKPQLVIENMRVLLHET